ncbi:MAG TPA: hypothetical protein VFA45_19755 [Actinomycetes bacterium]|nr:hypothetical protein [Actinomycetes bacterium]
MTTNNVMMVASFVNSVMNEPRRHLGEQVEPGDRSRAPGRLPLLQRFVNTWNQELPAEWDRLGTPAAAGAWLAANRLAATTRISAGDAA